MNESPEGMTIKEALEDVEIAFRQLEFTIRLLTYCELGKIEPTDFDIDHITLLDGGSLRLPTGNFSDADAITRAASISVLIAFSASVLVLDKAFEVAQIGPNPESADNVGQLRTLIYMIRCAQAHGLADPRWEVRGKYLRTLRLNVSGVDLSLDLQKLNGQRFHIDQIGGYLSWYRVRDSVSCALAESAS
jgi:hypothetical protein